MSTTCRALTQDIIIPTPKDLNSMPNGLFNPNSLSEFAPGENGITWCVVNFYHLVDLENPKEFVEVCRKWVGQKNITGRIYFSEQGVNCQYGGSFEDAVGFVTWLKTQPKFEGIRYSVWPASARMHPKLRLKYKPNLISLAGGMSRIPVTDEKARARPLEPAEWRAMLKQAHEDQSKKVVVLDVRNNYEWDAGHFVGAERPLEEEFNATPVGELEMDVPAYIKDLDKDAPVMMYCTGGIRCDVYSAFLTQKGYTNLYTLEGGIQNYMVKEGGELWNGSLFVFDGRMAVAPEECSPGTGDAQPTGGAAKAAVPCQVCGSAQASLPHVNCANIDCNELFIACTDCKVRLRGCCCDECIDAPRLLRPAQLGGGHYGAWGNYADVNEAAAAISTGRTREGRLARRERRRSASAERRQELMEEKLARKSMVREAMAKMTQLQVEDAETKAGAQPVSA